MSLPPTPAPVQTKEDLKAQGRLIREQARLVCAHLSRGGTTEYEDAQLRIWATSVGTRVWLLPPGRAPVKVYESTPPGIVVRCNPGLWMQYLAGLARTAAVLRDAREAAGRSDPNFEPVDDAALFADGGAA